MQQNRQPREMTISAIIPHEDNPELHIRDAEGNYPSTVHIEGNGTYEKTFSTTLGRDVVGRCLSVDRRAHEQEEGVDHIAYRAKPLTVELAANQSYQWR